jgi:hypothetical protein
MKSSLITSILISIGIVLFTACKTNQSMMDGDGANGWGMGWGMWFIPILIIVIILYFMRFKKRK